MKVLCNNREIGNDIYAEILDVVLSALRLGEKLLNTYSEEHLATLDTSDYDGLDGEEIATYLVEDDLNDINFATYNKIAMRIGTGGVFSNSTNSLFLDSMENMKLCFVKINQRISAGMPVDFNKNYRQQVSNALDLMVYCFINSFDLLQTADEVGVQSCVMEYCGNKNFTPVELASVYVYHFNNNRPNLSFFRKFPEMVVVLEEIISSDLFLDFLSVGGNMTKGELQDIVDGKIIVDEVFIGELEERLGNEYGV